MRDVRCDSVIRAVPLYIYGELPPDMEEDVEAHCAACADCQQEVTRYRTFASALNHHEIEPPLELLAECRQQLASQIRQVQPVPQNRWDWRQLFQWNIRVPLAASALVAMGYFGAQLAPMSSKFSQAGLVSTVRSVQPDASGQVRISVDDTRRRVVSGGAGDENIQRLLLAAVREEANPGLRVESVSVLKDMAASPGVRNALLEAVQHDPNPGVRLKALEGLKKFASDADVRKSLAKVLLNDVNPGVRIQAIDLLVSHHDDAMVGVLQNLIHKEENSYVRVRCERALQEMNASVGTF